MKVLVIDRDTLSTQLIRSKLELKGHTVVDEAVKNTALERLEKETFDTVFFDPAPLNNARPLVLGIRRSVRNYPYIVLMSLDMKR
ncbi:MAG TPA: DNA-binding response regulator, partial [Patescibacteria group bacterium]|nr:DNA-binding response regulator [Patescibacteria group bacterium]